MHERDLRDLKIRVNQIEKHVHKARVSNGFGKSTIEDELKQAAELARLVQDVLQISIDTVDYDQRQMEEAYKKAAADNQLKLDALARQLEDYRHEKLDSTSGDF